MELTYKNNDIVEVADKYGFGKSFIARIKGVASNSIGILGVTYIVEPIGESPAVKEVYDYDVFCVFEMHLTLVEDTNTESVIKQLKSLSDLPIRIKDNITEEEIKDSLIEYFKREYDYQKELKIHDIVFWFGECLPLSRYIQRAGLVFNIVGNEIIIVKNRWLDLYHPKYNSNNIIEFIGQLKLSGQYDALCKHIKNNFDVMSEKKRLESQEIVSQLLGEK